MNQISIVIVNYKVKHFLKQCLHAILNSSEGLDVKVWVVDNDSNDGSVEMVQHFFPSVKLIVNKVNVGFSKANNIALRQIKSKYTLILNPDTILSEDTLKKCYDHMESDDQIGMIGVRMIDGSGTYLPESKRGFPTPTSSFFKLSGLYKFFPKSSFVNHYYLGHLDENDTNDIEVLTGAFMFSRTDLLHQVSYFDEDYFMYGEDIDLSTKIIQTGHKLVYLPTTSIIHFKGESTKRDSAAYIKHFYQAMLIFTSKHFSGSKASIFSFFLKTGVFIRGLLGFINQVVIKRFAIVIDFIIAFLSLELITKLWANYYYHDANYYDGTSIHYNHLVYGMIWASMLYILGYYGMKFNIRKLIYGTITGTAVIFIIYALLGSDYNPSRVIIILGTLLFIFLILVKQSIGNFLDTGTFFISNPKINKVLIVANEEEVNTIQSKIENHMDKKVYMGFVQANNEESINSLGTLDQILEVVKTYEIDEVIFSLSDSKMSEIMPLMTKLGRNVSIKLTGGEHLNMIGSNSKNLTGEVYMMDIQYNVETIEKRRQKRFFDIVSGILSVVLYPILKMRNKSIRFSSLLGVIMGKLSYIGYQLNDDKLNNLPTLKNSIVSCDSIVGTEQAINIHDINLHYAKDYEVAKDFIILLRFYGW